MSTELSDLYASGVSNCCYAAVLDPSGEEMEGICRDCGEHCGIEDEETDTTLLDQVTNRHEWQDPLDRLRIKNG